MKCHLCDQREAYYRVKYVHQIRYVCGQCADNLEPHWVIKGPTLHLDFIQQIDQKIHEYMDKMVDDEKESTYYLGVVTGLTLALSILLE